jgi:hypothetical protein
MKKLGPIVEIAIPVILLESFKYSKNFSRFFSQFLHLFQGLCTPIRGFDIKFNDTKIPSLTKNGYYIDINCYYEYNSSTFYFMPLSFLPELKKKNLKLHNIIVECVKLMNNKGVTIINEPFTGDDEWLIETIEEYINVDKDNDDLDNDKLLAERELRLYKDYHTRYFENILCGPVNRNRLTKQVNNYKPVISIEKSIITWAKMVIDASQEPNRLEDFNFMAQENFAKQQGIAIEDIYNDGNPVEIIQCMRFTWFGCDGYTTIQTEYLGETASNFGELEFSHMYSCYSAEDIIDARNKFFKEWGFFPEKLTKLLEFGNNFIPDIWNYIDNKLIAILDTDGR